MVASLAPKSISIGRMNANEKAVSTTGEREQRREAAAEYALRSLLVAVAHHYARAWRAAHADEVREGRYQHDEREADAESRQRDGPGLGMWPMYMRSTTL